MNNKRLALGLGALTLSGIGLFFWQKRKKKPAEQKQEEEVVPSNINVVNKNKDDGTYVEYFIKEIEYWSGLYAQAQGLDVDVESVTTAHLPLLATKLLEVKPEVGHRVVEASRTFMNALDDLEVNQKMIFQAGVARCIERYKLCPTDGSEFDQSLLGEIVEIMGPLYNLAEHHWGSESKEYMAFEELDELMGNYSYLIKDASDEDAFRAAGIDVEDEPHQEAADLH